MEIASANIEATLKTSSGSIRLDFSKLNNNQTLSGSLFNKSEDCVGHLLFKSVAGMQHELRNRCIEIDKKDLEEFVSLLKQINQV